MAALPVITPGSVWTRDSLILEIPEKRQEGSYYLGVLLDFEDLIAEEDELNNSASRQLAAIEPIASETSSYVDTRLDLDQIALADPHVWDYQSVSAYFESREESYSNYLQPGVCQNLVFDPFDYVIPGTTYNTKDRLFGSPGSFLTPIQTTQFGTGRFLIRSTPVGVDTDADLNGVILFPYEFGGLEGICNITTTNKGTSPGLSTGNLHIQNALPLSFNDLSAVQHSASLDCPVSYQPVSPDISSCSRTTVE